MTGMQQTDKPRWLDVHAAWQLLGVIINSEPAHKEQFNQFHLDGNRIGYCTGAETCILETSLWLTTSTSPPLG